MSKFVLGLILAIVLHTSSSEAQVIFNGGGGSGGGGSTGWPTINVEDGITWAGAIASAAMIGNGTDWWAIGRDPTDGLYIVCVVAGVANDCNYIRKLAAGKIFEVQNSSGTAIFTITENTGAVTSLTMDLEANTITVPFRWDLDMCGVSPADGTTTGHIWNRDPLSSTPTLTADVDTNAGRCYMTFADTDSTFGAQITRQIPDGTFTGSFDADIWWNTTGTGNARFQIQTKCYADDEADDAAFNTASVVTAAAGTSGRPNKQTITGITTTGCAGGELMRIRFFRVRTEGSDTLNAALNVEKVVFKGRVIE
jgi:hypothetical protein